MFRNKLVNIANVLVLTADLVIKFGYGFRVTRVVIIVDEFGISTFVVVNVACCAVHTVTALEVKFTAVRVGMIEVETAVGILTITSFTTLGTVRKLSCGCFVLANVKVMICEVVHSVFCFIVNSDVKNVHNSCEKD